MGAHDGARIEAAGGAARRRIGAKRNPPFASEPKAGYGFASNPPYELARAVLIRIPLAPALGSTGSATDRSALFVGFTATMAESDFSRPCIIGYDSALNYE